MLGVRARLRSIKLRAEDAGQRVQPVSSAQIGQELFSSLIDYAITRRLRRPARPSAPVPRSASVPGSGTAEGEVDVDDGISAVAEKVVTPVP